MIQVCRDTSDAVALYLPQRLYLKSYAKLNISVQLPTHKVHGKSISNWELMEKLRKMAQPLVFSVLKVSKHCSDVIRFDAELENRDKLERVISRLEDRVVQLNDYPEKLRVRVSEAKSDFPSRHSWDSFFRDAADMDEMKPGERPDTVHITNIPIRWFVHEREKDADAPPSESIFRKVFDKFGEIRQVDVPASDPFRMQMKSAMRGITIPTQDSALYFEGYVQFSEYVGFVRCMDALRGKKLLRKKDDFAEWVEIIVDFDKTKHMTDAAVKRRAIVRERLASRQRAKDEEEKLEKEKVAKKEAKERMKQDRAERDKLERMREREERRKKKQLAKLMVKDNVDINSAAAEEELKLLKVQKKVQALRLVEELFKRIELRSASERNGGYVRTSDMSARHRMVERMKRLQEALLEEQRERLQQALDGRIVIRSALETQKPKPRDGSLSSLSSEGEPRDRYKRIKTEKLTTPERETEFKKALGVFGMPNPFGFGYPFPMQPGFPPYAQNPAMYYGGMPGAYYPPPAEYAARRGRGRGRARARGRGLHYQRYNESSQHDDRTSRRSRSHSRRRSYSRSRSHSRHRSRSRRRSYTRSRSRRRSRSRSRRSRSRHSRSKSRERSRKRSRTRSRSRRRTRSKSRSKTRSKSRSKSRSKPRSKSPPGEAVQEAASVDGSRFMSPGTLRRERSKSWSLPRDGEAKAWSKSPKDK